MKNVRPVLLLVALFSATFFVSTGCGSGNGGVGFGDDDDESEGGGLIDDNTCTSGQAWIAGESESPLMKPGGNCIGCHADRAEGPRYEVAGTVFGALDEPDDCGGVSGVTVILEGAEGGTLRLDTNAAGNFFAKSGTADLVTPVYARVEGLGGTTQMQSELSAFNCASCHTAQGANGAPGRILAP